MPASDNSMQVRFWGTRGTLPAPGENFLQTGGNTNCIEVTCGTETIIFDAGTGILKLGRSMKDRGVSSAHLLLTHAHYDHVEGIPFFEPLYAEGFDLNVYAGKLDGVPNTEGIFSHLLKRPYFPVGNEVFRATRSFHDLEPETRFTVNNDIKITAKPLNHPGGATGYRVDYKGASFACITDTEHLEGKLDENVLELIDNVDMFIYDSSYLDAEFPAFISYGHSTVEQGMRLAKEANAKRFMAFHHLPHRTDAELNQTEDRIREQLPDSGIAREQEVTTL